MELPSTGERLVTAQRDKTMVEHLHRYAFAMQFVSNKVVLDIASGEGYGCNLLSKIAKQVIGIDISVVAIEHSKIKYSKPNLTFLTGSVVNIPLPDHSVDIIVSFETIEHHNQHQEMMLEYKRVLTANGLLIISSPDKKYYSDIPKYHNPFHVKELYMNEFKTLLDWHFSNAYLFRQGITKGSILYKVDTKDVLPGCAVFHGSYEAILSSTDITSPDYNLMMASDSILPMVKDSFFESEVFDLELQQLKQQYTEDILRISNSLTFKIGRLIVKPFQIGRRILQKTLR